MDPHDLGRFFRGLLGFGGGGVDVTVRHRDDGGGGGRVGDGEELRREDQIDEGPNFHFRINIDPLEIHKFFEKEMEQMFKEFGGLGGIMGQQKYLEDLPATMKELPDSGQSDRDLMLKPDSEIVSPRLALPSEDSKDRDLDDQDISADQLDSLFKRDDHGRDMRKHPDSDSQWGGMFGAPEQGEASKWGFFGIPGGRDGSTGFHSFSYSRSMRTIQKPDGSVEIEERTRNPDGTESVVIRRRTGNHEETIFQDGNTSTVYKDLPPLTSPGEDEGILSPHHPHQDPLRHFNMIPGFGHMFSGVFGGHHPFNGGHSQFGSHERMPQPPPSDRMFSSIFSQFFGDDRR